MRLSANENRRLWTGKVWLFNGRGWFAAQVRVQAVAAHTAARRAILMAEEKATLPRRFQTRGFWIHLTPGILPRREVRRGTAD